MRPVYLIITIIHASGCKSDSGPSCVTLRVARANTSRRFGDQRVRRSGMIAAFRQRYRGTTLCDRLIGRFPFSTYTHGLLIGRSAHHKKRRIKNKYRTPDLVVHNNTPTTTCKNETRTRKNMTQSCKTKCNTSNYILACVYVYWYVFQLNNIGESECTPAEENR